MAANALDKYMYTGSPGTATTLSSPGYTTGVSTSITVGTTASFSTLTGQIFAIDTVEVVTINGVAEEVQVAGTYCVFSGVVTNGTTIANLTLEYGTAQSYAAGALTRVYIPVSSLWTERLIEGLTAEHNQLDGTHKNITSTNATLTNATITNLTVGSQAPSVDWTALGTPPNTVTYNGNRSYSLVFNTVDYTNILSPGQRLRTTRTVAAPTQCTSLNGSSQAYKKTSPNKLTFTDSFTCSAWVKPSAYGYSGIIGRFGATGFYLGMAAIGQLQIAAKDAGTSDSCVTYQSLPLNKWTHVAMTMVIATNTVTAYFDGVAVPTAYTNGTTTVVTQAGDLEVGSFNGANFFPGKIAQASVYSAVLSAATINGYITHGLDGTETSLCSAFSFDNAITDLNTTTPNDLTAVGSAVATNADSPFGTQASGLISSTLDYGIVQSAVFSTNTTVVVQVPEGCTIPTSGGVSAVSYSGLAKPYGFRDPGTVLGEVILMSNFISTTTPAAVDVTGLTLTVNIPTGCSGIRISNYTGAVRTTAAANTFLTTSIQEGATVLQGSSSTLCASYYLPQLVEYRGFPTAGSHTYKITISQSAAGTIAYTGGVPNPTYLRVELL